MEPAKPSTHNILDLPVEIQENILSSLGLKSQLRARQVCKLWSSLILNAPCIKSRRYINNFQSSPSGYFLSGSTCLHKLLCTRNTHEGRQVLFMGKLDLRTKQVESWKLRINARGQDSERPRYHYHELWGSPFLDELVITTFSRSNAPSRDVSLQQLKKVQYDNPANKEGAAAGGFRCVISALLRPYTECGCETWHLNLVDLATLYAKKKPESSWIQNCGIHPIEACSEDKIAKAMTLGVLLEVLPMKFVDEIDKRKAGDYSSVLCTICGRPSCKLMPQHECLRASMRIGVQKIDADGNWVIHVIIIGPAVAS